MAGFKSLSTKHLQNFILEIDFHVHLLEERLCQEHMELSWTDKINNTHPRLENQNLKRESRKTSIHFIV